MCGINGFVMLKGINRSEKTLAQIRYLFSELMVETQERGIHATGLAVFRRDGSYDFHKAALTADYMSTFDEKYGKIVEGISNETSLVIAHTRQFTQGKPENNDNNHPFEVGSIVGVHNGSVRNDYELFRTNPEFKRVGEVDSEIIFHLINKYNENEITYEGLKEALEGSKIKGLFALAFANKNDPLTVHIVKQERPMTIGYWKEAGILLFNSMEDFMIRAFRKLRRVNYQFDIDLKDPTVEYKTLEEHDYITLSANESDPAKAISKTQRLVLETTTIKTTTTSYGTAYTGSRYNGTGTGTGTQGNLLPAAGNTTTIETKDQIGNIIRGELNELTGEILIYNPDVKTNSQTTEDVSSADDGSGLFDPENHIAESLESLADEDSDDVIRCAECEHPLTETEIKARFNETASVNTMYCSTCFDEALRGYIEREEDKNNIITHPAI